MNRIVWAFLLLITSAAHGQESVQSKQIQTTESGAELCDPWEITGTYYFRMTATDADSNESALSNQVQKTDPTELCWVNPTRNVDDTTLADLAYVTLYWSTQPIIGEDGTVVEAIPNLPITLTGTAPESASRTLTLTVLPQADMTLTLEVLDADIAGEGRLTIGTWQQLLFDGQLGADNATHTVTYTIPPVTDCEVTLQFEHLTTAGYTVTAGSFEYLAGESCTVEPPVITDLPPVIFIE